MVLGVGGTAGDQKAHDHRRAFGLTRLNRPVRAAARSAVDHALPLDLTARPGLWADRHRLYHGIDGGAACPPRVHIRSKVLEFCEAVDRGPSAVAGAPHPREADRRGRAAAGDQRADHALPPRSQPVRPGRRAQRHQRRQCGRLPVRPVQQDLAIWTRGTIASEYQLDHDGLLLFLIHSRTRQGQSGSPVVFFAVPAWCPWRTAPPP